MSVSTLFPGSMKAAAKADVETKPRVEAKTSVRRQISVSVKKGSLSLVTGPMFSGKTLHILQAVERCVIARNNCLVIKWVGDARYGKQEELTSRKPASSLQSAEATSSRGRVRVVPTGSLDGVEVLDDDDNIFVDEGQFFRGLAETTNRWANNGYEVLVAALNGTAALAPWDEVSRLMPLVDGSLTLLKALCPKCKRETAFTGVFDPMPGAANADGRREGGGETYYPHSRHCDEKCLGDKRAHRGRSPPTS